LVPSQVFPCTAVVVGKSLVVVVVVVVGKSLVVVVGKSLVAVVGKSLVVAAVVGRPLPAVVLVGLGCWWVVGRIAVARNARRHHSNTGCPLVYVVGSPGERY
jgi:hypothetical protein